MNISQSGVDFIASTESYGKPLNDGSDRCIAYRCKIKKLPDGTWLDDGKWTIGYGCTEGVTEGMIWTREQAKAAFARELEKHSEAVNRLVTVALGQRQFDALVSFSYNCGAGALGSSTLLRLLNSGDYAGAAEQFGRFIRSRGQVVPGLITRRANERAMFLADLANDDGTPAEDVPDMPQNIDAPPVNATKAHQEAHKQLKSQSAWYAIKSKLLGWLGLGTPASAAAVGLTSSAIEPRGNAWTLPSMQTVETALMYVSGYGWKLVAGALVIAFVLEASNLLQRKPIVQENA